MERPDNIIPSKIFYGSLHETCIIEELFTTDNNIKERESKINRRELVKTGGVLRQGQGYDRSQLQLIK